MNKNILGKGLKDLLQENEYKVDDSEAIIELPLDEIKPNPYQPRYLFNEEKIKELSESIKEHGIFQPIIVKKMNGYYSIVAGERRYRACKLLGFKTIPAIVRMYEKEKMIQIALIENLQREDLSPIEEAKGYLQIMRELDLTQKDVGLKVGKSRSHVTNMLGLLNLPNNVLEMVDSGMISMGHARVLSKLEDIDLINNLANLIVEKELSVRDIEKIVRQDKEQVDVRKDNINYFEKYEKTLSEKYNVKISIKNKKIIFQVADEKMLEEILEKLSK